MAQHNEIGKWGETVAAEFYVKQGYAIAQRNWKMGHLEVDLIVQKDDLIVIVEVKTRRSAIMSGNPAAAVTAAKINNLIMAADIYMRQQHAAMRCRFDVIAITGDPNGYELQHIPNAFLRPIFARRSRVVRRLKN